MKKALKTYVLVAFPVSYACFGAYLWKGGSMETLGRDPLGLLLMAMGCLGPLLGALVAQKHLGGMEALKAALKPSRKAGDWGLTALFLLLHFGLAFFLTLATGLDRAGSLLWRLPLALVLFGGQELGWRAILQPALEETRPFWKAVVATGLIVALWFLPLCLIPGFLVPPAMYIQLAFLMVGFHLLSTTLYRRTGSLLCCVIFAGVYYALSTFINFQQGGLLLGLVAVDVVVGFSYNSRVIKENVTPAVK